MKPMKSGSRTTSALEIAQFIGSVSRSKLPVLKTSDNSCNVCVVGRTVLKQFLSGIILFAERSGVLIYMILWLREILKTHPDTVLTASTSYSPVL
jgi:hypothetical protein